MKYDFFEDPGHGWLKVSRKELITLGIADEISAYSYQLGNYVYLEEDADLTCFVEVWKSVNKKEFNDVMINKHFVNYPSYIRCYDCYKRES